MSQFIPAPFMLLAYKNTSSIFPGPFCVEQRKLLLFQLMNMNNTNNSSISSSSYEPCSSCYSSNTDRASPVLETQSLRLREYTRDPE